jgi:isopenicillin-N epimerase
MSDLRYLFHLRRDVVFLNHGSFGSCPKPVMEAYQQWQLELERQPVEFLGRRFADLMYDARTALAYFLGAGADDVVYVTNATTGLNIVAGSLALEPGDEVLSTDQEYGAAERMWEVVCERRGARFVRRRVPLPLQSKEQVVDAVWSGVTKRTKVLFMSHIAPNTALILPVEELVARARDAGIISVVDGAHAPGQIDLDLASIGADFYAGNCHKWLMAPKGAAFLYARPEKQRLLEPLVVSWGDLSRGESRFIQENEWQGTRDVSAFLSVPAAIEFRKTHDWPAVQRRCYELVALARGKLAEVTGVPPLSPEGAEWFRQMAAHPLPPCDAQLLKQRLYDEFAVEVPVNLQNDVWYLRVSVQGYNSATDVGALSAAMSEVLPGLIRS